MVSLIGPRWVECFDTTNPKLDFVEEEIKAVLRRGVLILPILVDGAITPEDYSKIPATIQDVLKRQMIPIHDADFGGGIVRLVDSIERTTRIRRVNKTSHVSVHCKECGRETVHKQSKPSEDHFDSHKYVDDGENRYYSPLQHQSVLIRHCGCGAPHLHLMSWDDDTVHDGGPLERRFDMAPRRSEWVVH